MLNDQKKPGRRKLAHEIVGILAVTFVISLFLWYLLFACAVVMAEGYCAARDIVLTDAQLLELDNWVFSLSLLVSVGFFLILFLFLLGERLAYIWKIIKGIDILRSGRLDYELPLEGSNELTSLAAAVNYLSATQRQIKEKERALNEEKEQLIRTLSHDIRTPLTSILSYSELLSSRESSTSREEKEYLDLIRHKAEQIKELTDILLDGGRRNPERFEDARLLMEQLADEFEQSLEEEYSLTVDLTGCIPFSGTFDVGELRRIFDNLISNIQKYADSESTVLLSIGVENRGLVIRQRNARRTLTAPAESYQMGLNSIRRIAHQYGGQTEVRQDEESFEITIILSEI